MRTSHRFSFAGIAIGLFSLALGGCGSSNDADHSTGSKGECDFKLSSYAGDCLALSAPPATDGFQLHFGPSNYDDQAEVDKYVLQPHDEKVLCFYTTTPNAEDAFFLEYHATARPGTHHMIVFAGADPDNKVPADGTLEPCPGGAGRLPFLVGAQNGIDPKGARIDIPEPGKPIAPENKGFGIRLGAKSRVGYQLHYVNQSDKPILQESWANFKYVPPAQVTQVVTPLFWIGGLTMNVQPQTQSVVKAQCTNDTGREQRLPSLVGHMHAHTSRFTAHKFDAATNERTLVYETFDWAHAEMFYYDSITKNPESNAAQRIAGAASGELVLKPNDRIEWECEVHNDTNAPLHFANEAYTAEMCNVFGSATPGPGTAAWNCFSL